MIRAAVAIKAWIAQPPPVDEVRLARCAGCGASSRPVGGSLNVHGQGLVPRQVRGVLEVDGEPRVHVLAARRYECQRCGAVMTVVPAEQSTTKKRPAVVISSAAYHRQRPDPILMAVTSQFRPAQTVGEVVVQHWQAAGLIKPSVLKPLFTTIERGLVLRTMGSLHTTALRKALDDILGK